MQAVTHELTRTLFQLGSQHKLATVGNGYSSRQKGVLSGSDTESNTKNKTLLLPRRSLGGLVVGGRRQALHLAHNISTLDDLAKDDVLAVV